MPHSNELSSVKCSSKSGVAVLILVVILWINLKNSPWPVSTLLLDTVSHLPGPIWTAPMSY